MNDPFDIMRWRFPQTVVLRVCPLKRNTLDQWIARGHFEPEFETAPNAPRTYTTRDIVRLEAMRHLSQLGLSPADARRARGMADLILSGASHWFRQERLHESGDPERLTPRSLHRYLIIYHNDDRGGLDWFQSHEPASQQTAYIVIDCFALGERVVTALERIVEVYEQDKDTVRSSAPTPMKVPA